MTQSSRKAPRNPIRFAHFREHARLIVHFDRSERKAGRKVDLAGMITRSLERAYQFGFEAALEPDPVMHSDIDRDGDIVEMIMIPPRSRATFRGLCFHLGGDLQNPMGAACLIPAVTERGTPGWRLDFPGRKRGTELQERKAAIGRSSVNVLVRLGLFELAGPNDERLVLSAKGLASWRHHCATGDPNREA